jgi:hypothetical protein
MAKRKRRPQPLSPCGVIPTGSKPTTKPQPCLHSFAPNEPPILRGRSR